MHKPVALSTKLHNVLANVLFRMIHFVSIRELSGKGGDLIVPKVAREYLGLARLRKLDKK